jgi:hypothetical protein
MGFEFAFMMAFLVIADAQPSGKVNAQAENGGIQSRPEQPSNAGAIDSRKISLDYADPFEAEPSAIRAGASGELEEGANRGDAEAQYQLGIFYARRREPVAALRWWKKAAEHGHAWAQTNLGATYWRGSSVPVDYAEGVRWYRKAANQGIAFAQNELGYAYDVGKGVPQDHAEAARWYRKAANQGLAASQNNLGVLYADGKGVPQDYAEAYFWGNLAAALETEAGRDSYIKLRDSMSGKLSREQLSRTQKKCRQWLAAFEKRRAKK